MGKKWHKKTGAEKNRSDQKSGNPQKEIPMSDRRLNPISDAELNRRWKAVRAGMAERGIDALVMQNNNDWLGGYVKWFTDFPAYNGYPRTRDLPCRRRHDRGRHGPGRLEAQFRRTEQGPSRRRRVARHAGLHLDRLYRRLSGRACARRIEAARLPADRPARGGRHAAIASSSRSRPDSPARPRSWTRPNGSTPSRRSRARRKCSWCGFAPRCRTKSSRASARR